MQFLLVWGWKANPLGSVSSYMMVVELPQFSSECIHLIGLLWESLELMSVKFWKQWLTPKCNINISCNY